MQVPLHDQLGIAVTAKLNVRLDGPGDSIVHHDIARQDVVVGVPHGAESGVQDRRASFNGPFVVNEGQVGGPSPIGGGHVQAKAVVGLDGCLGDGGDAVTVEGGGVEAVQVVVLEGGVGDRGRASGVAAAAVGVTRAAIPLIARPAILPVLSILHSAVAAGAAVAALTATPNRFTMALLTTGGVVVVERGVINQSHSAEVIDAAAISVAAVAAVAITTPAAPAAVAAVAAVAIAAVAAVAAIAAVAAVATLAAGNRVAVEDSAVGDGQRAVGVVVDAAAVSVATVTTVAITTPAAPAAITAIGVTTPITTPLAVATCTSFASGAADGDIVTDNGDVVDGHSARVVNAASSTQATLATYAVATAATTTTIAARTACAAHAAAAARAAVAADTSSGHVVGDHGVSGDAHPPVSGIVNPTAQAGAAFTACAIATPATIATMVSRVAGATIAAITTGITPAAPAARGGIAEDGGIGQRQDAGVVDPAAEAIAA